MALAVVAIPPVVAFGIGCGAILVFAILFAPRDTEVAPSAPPKPPERNGDSPAARALIERLPSPVLIISRSGLVTFANRAAHEALPRLQTGTHFSSVIRAAAFVEAVNASLADGEEHAFEFSTHEGRDRTFEARTSLLTPEGGTREQAQAVVQLEDRHQNR